MTKEEIKGKEDRLSQMYLTYYRLFMKINEDCLALEKMKVELSNLADEIEKDYNALSVEKEK